MLKEEVRELKEQADRGRALLMFGEIEYKEAKVMVEPYINAVNEKSIEIAKKYNMKPKKTTVRSFLR